MPAHDRQPGAARCGRRPQHVKQQRHAARRPLPVCPQKYSLQSTVYSLNSQMNSCASCLALCDGALNVAKRQQYRGQRSRSHLSWSAGCNSSGLIGSGQAARRRGASSSWPPGVLAGSHACTLLAAAHVQAPWICPCSSAAMLQVRLSPSLFPSTYVREVRITMGSPNWLL